MPFQERPNPVVRMMFRQLLVLSNQSVREMEACMSDRLFRYDQPTMLMLMQISMAGLGIAVTVVIIHAKMH